MKNSQSGFRNNISSTRTTRLFNTRGIALESEGPTGIGKIGLHIKKFEIKDFYDFVSLTKKTIQQDLEVLVMILKDKEFNKSFIYFTVPGISLRMVDLFTVVSIYDSI
jgi:hypothetical protein